MSDDKVLKLKQSAMEEVDGMIVDELLTNTPKEISTDENKKVEVNISSVDKTIEVIVDGETTNLPYPHTPEISTDEDEAIKSLKKYMKDNNIKRYHDGIEYVTGAYVDIIDYRELFDNLTLAKDAMEGAVKELLEGISKPTVNHMRSFLASAETTLSIALTAIRKGNE